MATRRKVWSKRSFRGGKTRAPWRETRSISSAIGGDCSAGFSLACDNPTVPGSPTPLTSPTDPCSTISIYPVLWPPDFQPAIGGNISWKERVVHVATTVDLHIIPNNLWVNDMYKEWLACVNAGAAVCTEVFTVPWRAGIVKLDLDEALDIGAQSLFDENIFEDERFVPGTIRSGVFWAPGLVGSQMNATQRCLIKTRAKRRVDSSEGLFFQFEIGCVSFSGFSATANEAYDAYGPPLWGIGQLRSTYIE